MSFARPRAIAILAILSTHLVMAAAGLGQSPSPWKKAAPFPEPDEELYGVTVNGKLYVIGGWGGGKARGANYEYNPSTEKWTKKKSMPRPAHHAAKSLMFPLPAPMSVPKKAPVPWDPAHPYAGLGFRGVQVKSGGEKLPITEYPVVRS